MISYTRSASSAASGISEIPSLTGTLQPLSFHAELQTYVSHFVEGTRDWVYQEIEAWRRDVDPCASQCLALFAPMGFGKTLIFARL